MMTRDDVAGKRRRRNEKQRRARARHVAEVICESGMDLGMATSMIGWIMPGDVTVVTETRYDVTHWPLGLGLKGEALLQWHLDSCINTRNKLITLAGQCRPFGAVVAIVFLE